jgi:hypothetical protein
VREKNANYRRRRVELKGALTSVVKGGKHHKYKTGITPRLCASNIEGVMFGKIEEKRERERGVASDRERESSYGLRMVQ